MIMNEMKNVERTQLQPRGELTTIKCCGCDSLNQRPRNCDQLLSVALLLCLQPGSREAEVASDVEIPDLDFSHEQTI